TQPHLRPSENLASERWRPRFPSVFLYDLHLPHEYDTQDCRGNNAGATFALQSGDADCVPKSYAWQPRRRDTFDEDHSSRATPREFVSRRVKLCWRSAMRCQGGLLLRGLGGLHRPGEENLLSSQSFF